MEAVITVVGIGPGNPLYILPAGLKQIKSSRVIVGSKRALDDLALDNQKRIEITGKIDLVIEKIKGSLMNGDVTVLVSGDPGYYSLLDALRRHFPVEKIKVIPGISSVQFAFSKLSIPWHDATFISFHGRVPDEAAYRYEKGKLLGILTDSKNNSATISEKLIESGWPKEAKISVCSRLSYDDEEIRTSTLEEATSLPVKTHSVLVVEG